jgi:hypothetical protein
MPRDTFLLFAADVLSRNGYDVVERTDDHVVGHDTITNVSNGYKLLVRRWQIWRDGDSVVLYASSINNRADDSDVTQTWDRRQGGVSEKDWMRPVLVGVEGICATGTPIAPGAR